jgi:murein DD-endopeptidase MepM/ murein hydrolase activator NlpD
MILRCVAPTILLCAILVPAAYPALAGSDFKPSAHGYHDSSHWNYKWDGMRDIRHKCRKGRSSACRLIDRICSNRAAASIKQSHSGWKHNPSKWHKKFKHHPAGAKPPRWIAKLCRNHLPDRDGDAVPDSADVCLNTPTAARSVVAGCAAHEVVANPEVVAAPMRRAYADAFEILNPPAHDERPLLFKKFRGQMYERLDAAMQQADSGLQAVANANVCAGARDIADARDTAEGTRQTLVEALTTQWAELERVVSEEDTDADTAEVAFHEAAYQAGVISRAISATGELQQAVGQVCEQVRQSREFKAVITATDEATGVFQIDNGRFVAIADDADTDPIFEGSTVSIRSNQFGDGHFAASKVSQLDSGITDIVNEPDFPCSFLRIAPFQEFAPEAIPSGAYVLHAPAGYRADDGDYLVESVTRFAARHFSACPLRANSQSGRGARFSYSLELQYRTLNQTSFTTFASDLRDGDTPVGLPPLPLAPVPGSPVSVELRVIDKIATCRGRRCGVGKVHTTTDYPLKVYARGDLVQEVVMNRLFDLEDWDTNAFEAGIVTGITPAAELNGLPAAFNAQGLSIDGQRNLVSVDNTANKFYAIYQDDFIDANPLNALAQHGTTLRSGLRWPRIVGTRGGWPFWYSAIPAQIVRDRVGDCVPGPDAFYRMPWTFNDSYGVGQGNQSPPAADPDDNPSHLIGTSQQFAFDFGLPSSTVVRAARGGLVDWFANGIVSTFNPNQDVSPTNIPFPQGNLGNWGNAVRIAHQDGTFAWYFHLETGSISLATNQRIERGQPIALSDNTGRSSGPHLHFQVQADNIDWGQSIQIRFGNDCTIPETGGGAFSDNINPNFPG